MKEIIIVLSIVLSISIIDSSAQEFPDLGVKVETIAQGLKVPWSIAFAPDDKIFVTERGGNLRIIQDGKLKPNPIATINVGTVEGGLLGITLDPNYKQNHYIYMYYTYTELFSTFNRISRFTESNDKITDEFILIDKIPGGPIHDGGRIKFGPDKKLYASTGDAGQTNLAQDLNSLAGKILRINPDGTIPKDNPFENSPVYSLGHRNPQGFDWHPITGKMYAVEHGPSGERGFAHDELNLVESGKNYGWPDIIGDQTDAKYTSPIYHTGDITWAPSGATFYNSDQIPQWSNKYFIATLRGSHLGIIDVIDGKIQSNQEIFSDTFGRIRDASVGPDGHLYLLTSNRDGRGSPISSDDRVLKITPLDIPSPLKQMETITDPYKVQCRYSLELVLKTDNTPACVKAQSIQRLLDIGWILP